MHMPRLFLKFGNAMRLEYSKMGSDGCHATRKHLLGLRISFHKAELTVDTIDELYMRYQVPDLDYL